MAMSGLYDIHCHLVPYVDDGAFTMEEAVELLEMQYEQDVRTIVVTPHFRTRMFETPEEKVSEKFLQLKKAAAEDPELKELRLFLGREYYCDRGFWDLVASGAGIRTLGPSQAIMIEFSTRDSLTPEYMIQSVEKLKELGLVPVIAHVERYVPIQTEPENLARLRERGAWIQVNAASILGEEGRAAKHLAWKILKNGLADLIASDAHHVEFREPNLERCARLIGKKLGETTARRLFRTNQEKLLGMTSEEGAQG